MSKYFVFILKSSKSNSDQERQENYVPVLNLPPIVDQKCYYQNGSQQHSVSNDIGIVNESNLSRTVSEMVIFMFKLTNNKALK